MRYPERQIVAVPAEQVYYEPAKPFPANPDAATGPSRREPDVLDITDVIGSRVVERTYQKPIGGFWRWSQHRVLLILFGLMLAVAFGWFPRVAPSFGAGGV